MTNFKISDNFFQNNTKFFGSYFENDKIPTNKRSTEIAILGRSNVGKSSLINAIGLNKNLAYTSKRPGCTISINFYQIGTPEKQLFLVDLPGYGYAKRSEKEIGKATSLITDYVLDREELKKIYLLIDSRVGIQNADGEFITFFNQQNIHYQIILTKIDKVNKKELEILEKLLTSFFQPYTNVSNQILKASSKNNMNINIVRNTMYQDFNNTL
jgi:GTP-binding protein